MDHEPNPADAPSRDRVIASRYDALASLFTGILMQLQAASDLPIEMNAVRGECLLKAETLARRGLREVRELVELQILVRDHDEDSLTAMRTLVHSVACSSNTLCDFGIQGSERPLKISVAITLQRVLQEALTNAQRYANAKHIMVQLDFEHDRVILEIRDDGSGFTPDISLSSGFGLMGMRARIDRLGGALWLRSAPGEGTHVRVDLSNPYLEP